MAATLASPSNALSVAFRNRPLPYSVERSPIMLRSWSFDFLAYARASDLRSVMSQTAGIQAGRTAAAATSSRGVTGVDGAVGAGAGSSLHAAAMALTAARAKM